MKQRPLDLTSQFLSWAGSYWWSCNWKKYMVISVLDTKYLSNSFLGDIQYSGCWKNESISSDYDTQ